MVARCYEASYPFSVGSTPTHGLNFKPHFHIKVYINNKLLNKNKNKNKNKGLRRITRYK
jgi:hypothetical protein